MKQNLLIFFINLLPKDLYKTLFLYYFKGYQLTSKKGEIMAKGNSKKTDYQHQNASDGLGTTTDNLTSRGGLLLVLQVFKSLRLKKLANGAVEKVPLSHK